MILAGNHVVTDKAGILPGYYTGLEGQLWHLVHHQAFFLAVTL